MNKILDRLTDLWLSPAGLVLVLGALVAVLFWIFQLDRNDIDYGKRLEKIESTQASNRIAREEMELRTLVELQKLAVITAKTTAIQDGLLRNQEALAKRIDRAENMSNSK